MVAVGIAHHPLSGREMRSPVDSRALEMALSLQDKKDTQLCVVHIGDRGCPPLQEYLGLGIRQLDVIHPRHGDPTELLVGYASQEKPDLIMTGSRGRESSGLIPYLLADSLGLSLVHNALRLQYADNLLRVTQFLPGGKRQDIKVPLPIVVIAHPQAPLTVRYAWSRAQQGALTECEVAPITVKQLSTGWRYGEVAMGRKRLTIPSGRSGFERMQKAIALGGGGGRIIKEGSVAAKAEEVISLLKKKRLL